MLYLLVAAVLLCAATSAPPPSALEIHLSAHIHSGRMTIAGTGNLPDGLRVIIAAIASNVGNNTEQSLELGSETQGSAVFHGGKFETAPLLCENAMGGISGPFSLPCTPATYMIDIATGPAYIPDVIVDTAIIGGNRYVGQGLRYMPSQHKFGLEVSQSIRVGN